MEGQTFDLGRVIERTFASVGRNWAIYLGGAIVLVGIPSVIAGNGQLEIETGVSATGIAYLVGGAVLNVIGSYLLQGMVMKAAVNGFNGSKTGFGDALTAGMARFWPLLGLATLAGLGILVGALLLIIPGLIVAVMWSVAAPVVVVEKRGVFESFDRSVELTRGHRWAIFALIVIYSILNGVFSAILAGVGGGLAAAFSELEFKRLSALAVTPLANVISAVVGAAGIASLYYELRSSKEGVGADHLAAIFD